MEACGDYGLTREDAGRIVDEVREAIGCWREVAADHGIPRWEREAMAAAFEES